MLRKYQVQGRIRTLAKLNLERTIHVRGYTFSQWAYNSGAPVGRSWHMVAEIAAETIEDCAEKFHRDLADLTDRIAFVSQCYTACEAEPYIIIPLQENEHKDFFYCYASERGATGLHCAEDEESALVTLEKYQPEGNVFRLLREATNSPWFYTRFSMLVACLEAIAVSAHRPKGMTERQYIAHSILRDKELTESLFKYRHGIRNQVLHGIRIDEARHGKTDYIRIIHDSIKRYFQEVYGIALNDQVKNPMRHPAENYETWKGWVRPIASKYTIDLREVWELSRQKFRSQAGVDENAQKFDAVFEILATKPSYLR